jgi:hypothetical protein
MLELLAGFVTMGATIAVGSVGYLQSRRFVAKKLRFVDQAQNPAMPVVAGVAAVAIATPVAAVLPFITAFTAIVFGLSVAFGARAGVKSFGRALMP